MAQKIRVILVDDHEMVRLGLKSFFNLQPDVEVIGEAGNGIDGIKLALDLKPDVVVMDLVMPEMSGVEATLKLLKEWKEAKILVLTSYLDNEKIYPVIEAGAKGYMLKTSSAAEILNAIASHHGDVEPESVIAVIVAAADALSSARPGARNESMENYIKRLRDLEEIAKSFDGVQNSYALQAGREIRIMVQPNKISDDEVTIIAHKVREKIENNLDYPGNIKVTVIRELRAVDYAK